jgi:arylsulfatase A-like enzyme
MRRSRILTIGAAVVTASALSVTGMSSGANAGSSHPPQPAARVVIVLFDQMLPQYADQFRMPNFRKLRDHGVDYNKAYLGYMASETVLAHNVIPSGLLPKNMGYTDEAYRDHGNVFGKNCLPVGDPCYDKVHITGDLSLADFITIQKNHGLTYPKLADYLHADRPGTKFITVGEKSYAVETATGASGDIAVRLSSRKSNFASDPANGGCSNLAIPGFPANKGWRGPQGKNVPTYLTAADPKDPTKCGRFYINSDSANDYGTADAFPSWLYPSDGNRYWPGNDPKHLGGDTWVADAAIAMMKKEPWSGMFITMGAIDKAAHMWGAQADVAPKQCKTLEQQTHVKCAAENADAQLGKLLDTIKQVDKAKGGKTLVVLTADHGATYGKHFLGKTTSGAGDSNWYYAPPELGVWDAGSGATEPDTETYSDPSDAVKNILNADGNVQFSYQSTAIETWLIDHSEAKKKAKASTMLHMPGAIASYWRDGDHFVLRGTNWMSPSEKSWWKAHGQEIVNTMAADDGPDVIGLLHDKFSYGVYGDHGGAQQTVQRVPMVFWSPGIGDRSTGEKFRTPDLLPTILRAMNIGQTSPTDGIAHTVY